MLEQIWRLTSDTLDTDDALRPLIERVVATPGFEPKDYDLNQMEQWRRFDVERAVVDGLTQRTQLLRIRGEGQGVVAMVAMGKHGEEPTAVIRLPDDGGQSLPDYVADWDELFDTVGPRVGLITSPEWRRALDDAGIAWEDETLSPAIVLGWPRETAPDELLADIEPALQADGPAHVERVRGGKVLWLAPAGRLEDDVHRRQIQRIGEAVRTRD